MLFRLVSLLGKHQLGNLIKCFVYNFNYNTKKLSREDETLYHNSRERGKNKGFET